MHCNNIVFTQHAFTRMFAREIHPLLVKQAIRRGEVIVSYPEDTPYPSFLMLYHQKQNRALHIVVGFDGSIETCYIVTAYWPNPNLWSGDFRTRRQR